MTILFRDIKILDKQTQESLNCLRYPTIDWEANHKKRQEMVLNSKEYYDDLKGKKIELLCKLLGTDNKNYIKIISLKKLIFFFGYIFMKLFVYITNLLVLMII